MAGYQILHGRTGGGGGAGTTVSIGPTFGEREDETFELGAEVSLSEVAALYDQELGLAVALEETSIAFADDMEVGAAQSRSVALASKLSGTTDVTQEDQTDDGWQNIPNAQGDTNGTLATLDAGLLGTNSGTLVFDYPTISGLISAGFQIRKCMVHFYTRQTGQLLFPGTLQHRYRINGGSWVNLATHTGNVDFLTTPQTFNLIAVVDTMTELDTLEFGVFGSIQLTDLTLSQAVDAVHIEWSAIKAMTPDDDLSTFGTRIYHLDPYITDDWYTNVGKTIRTRADGAIVKAAEDIAGGSDFIQTGNRDPVLVHDASHPAQYMQFQNSLPNHARLQKSITATTTQATIFCVIRHDGTGQASADHLYTSASSFTAGAVRIAVGTGRDIQVRNDANSATLVPYSLGLSTPFNDRYEVIALRANSGGIDVWRNGVHVAGPVAGATAFRFENIVLNNQGGFKQTFLGEQIAYSSALSDANVDAVNQYLNRKWGVS